MNLIILVLIIKMKYKYFIKTLLLVILSVSLNAQDHSVHKKWELSGADERIQQNRKGDVVLEFILDDKINKSVFFSKEAPIHLTPKRCSDFKRCASPR